MSFIRALVAFAVAALAANAFAAARSVTVLGVSGVDGAKFAASLERELAELYDLVPGARYREKSLELGKRGASPDEVRAVAAAIHADAVIGGAVAGRGRTRVLLVAVREGASGRVVARARYGLARRTLPVIRETVLANLVRALERVHPIGSAPSTTLEPETITSNEAPEETGTPASEAREEVSPEEAVTKVMAPRRPVAGVQAGVGPSLLARSLGFDVASAPSYSGGTVGGIRAEGAVFPLALSSELAAEHPVLASFGFAGSYEYVFGFTSTTATGRSSGHASRWEVRFVGRIPLGHGARAGVMTLDTGITSMSWGHAAPVDVGVPDVRYDLVGGGLGWERALGTRWIILALRLGFDGLLSAGDIASDAQYGSAGGWATELGGSWTARPRDWLWLRLAFHWDRVALSFAGAGTRFARAATDSWVGGALEVGFAL